MRSPDLSPMRIIKHCVNLFQGKSVCLLFFCLACISTVSLAQSSLIVTGTVTRQNGEPLVGVSVMVKGTGAGTTTQADGSFRIEAPPNSTLVLSYIGFVAREIKIGSANQANGNILLLENKNEL